MWSAITHKMLQFVLYIYGGRYILEKGVFIKVQEIPLPVFQFLVMFVKRNDSADRDEHKIHRASIITITVKTALNLTPLMLLTV